MGALKFAKKCFILIGQVIYSFILILLISGIPVLFSGMKLNIQQYAELIKNLGTSVLFFDNESFWSEGPIFPQVFQRTMDSFYLIGLVLLSSIALSIILASVSVLLFRKQMKWIKRFILVTEAIPDIFIITVLQFIIIAILKETNVRIFKVASFGDEKAVVLPVICLTIPAAVYLLRILIKTIQEEFDKPYAELAKAIGNSPFKILVFHISRNAFHKMMITSKTLIWSILSSLVIIEYIFNYPGIMSFLLTYPSPEIFLAAVAILFLPFFIVYQSYLLFVPDLIKGEKS